jgi:lipoyl(octanoyl) transferase
MHCIVAPRSIFSQKVTENKDCLVVWLGRIAYSRALDLQMQICKLKKRGFDKDVLLLLEHPPTITMGRSGKRDHLLVKEADLKSRGISFWNVDRGGDITFHGPGQLVGYPILLLQGQERDVRSYMRRIEESLIRLLACYEIEAIRVSQFTGVWTPKGKIAAMGVHISRWITRHGFALNVNTDLSFYDLIVPCGIADRGVTSMQKHILSQVNLAEVADRYSSEFGRVFERSMIPTKEEVLLGKLSQFEENIGAIDMQTPPNTSSARQ